MLKEYKTEYGTYMLDVPSILKAQRKRAAARSYEAMKRRSIDLSNEQAFYVYYKSFEAMEKAGKVTDYDSIEAACFERINNIKNLF